MPDNPPEDTPRISPYLYYNDVTNALSWLHKAFQLEKRLEMPGPDGKPIHAEMSYEDGVIMLGPSNEELGSLSPIDINGINQHLYVYVDDVDRHYQHAKLAGAEIIVEPEDSFWGDRMYVARDLEGHKWTFATHTQDIALEDMNLPE